ncbi:gluconate 2-dehydrogenase subunit 3 family protein [Parahaliea mediterranea]|uniref:gluconate 2-dehydrogenase subunit 3 family protein n=1 Tax=Parahaliea mediterranea TaxID=651086 RepID=UPI000E2F3829|nr:gluconate 2-dehydrogenase subunit 3 family protein [Parahaliea mediterranea]
MNRREFLQAAALLVAGASTVPRGWTMSHEQQAFLAAQPDYIDRHTPSLFSPAQRATVAAMAEQVIPATDTPGAIDAGVPRFIELMVADWFDEGERQTFMQGLDAFMASAGGDFAALAPTAQLDLLEQAEAAAGDSHWYDMGSALHLWDSTTPFICQLKELTVLGFFLSETGATEVLRNNPMGSFQGSVPLSPDDTAYNTTIPLRVMFGAKANAI